MWPIEVDELAVARLRAQDIRRAAERARIAERLSRRGGRRRKRAGTSGEGGTT
jgi:hypothetical protein